MASKSNYLYHSSYIKLNKVASQQLLLFVCGFVVRHVYLLHKISNLVPETNKTSTENMISSVINNLSIPWRAIQLQIGVGAVSVCQHVPKQRGYLSAALFLSAGISQDISGTLYYLQVAAQLCAGGEQHLLVRPSVAWPSRLWRVARVSAGPGSAAPTAQGSQGETPLRNARALSHLSAILEIVIYVKQHCHTNLPGCKNRIM